MRNIPAEVRARLAREAKAKDESLNQTAIDAMASGLGVSNDGKPKRDVSFFTMTEHDAKLIENIVAEMDVVDCRRPTPRDTRRN